MKDAIGNDIIIGATYGYSQRTNGVVKTVVGTATHLTGSSVGLKVLKRFKTKYADDTEVDKTEYKRSSVAVISNTLFKVEG